MDEKLKTLWSAVQMCWRVSQTMLIWRLYGALEALRVPVLMGSQPSMSAQGMLDWQLTWTIGIRASCEGILASSKPVEAASAATYNLMRKYMFAGEEDANVIVNTLAYMHYCLKKQWWGKGRPG
jgi:hypothetical protein